MWFIYALTFAFLSSVGIIIAKKVMKEMDEYSYLLFGSLFTFPFLLAISLLFYKLPNLDRTFWLVTILGTLMSVMAAILAYKAIRSSEVSLVNPISAFNPVFTTIFSFLILSERISLRDISGILLVVIGAYLLQASKLKEGIFAPLKALILHRGVQLSFLAYFIWSITPIFEKTAIFHTNPQNPPFAALMGQMVAILIYFPIVYKFSSGVRLQVQKNWKILLLVGILGGFGITSAFLAMSLNSLGITTAIFKLSLIFVPVLSYFFFKEKDIKNRLLGSFVMLIGVALILL
jgi:uncharacterized membrane protein